MRAGDADEELLLHEPLLDAGERNSEDGSSTKRRKSAKPMAVVEQLMLSPYEKWLTHGRFPYKIVLHGLLIALTCTQMVIYDAQNAAYMRATHRNWYALRVFRPCSFPIAATAFAYKIDVVACLCRAYFFLPPAADIGVV